MALDYHLEELRIADAVGHSKRVMPPLTTADRAVLDLGCGAGQTLIATDFAPGTVVIGLDVDRSALAFGKKLDERISFVCGRGESLPFQSDGLDFVFSRVALPYMNLHDTLSEIRRVLKTGGRLWLVLHPCSMVVKETLEALSHLNLKRAAVCLYVIANGTALNSFGKEFHLPFRKNYYESFQTIRGTRKLLRKAGFDDVQVERSRFFVATARKGH
jgi:ubiquinone/menaquinone biosynthesis C-methylase UbiE